MFKRNILVVACTCLAIVRCEPPTGQYGTPLAAPISSYGTPNYNANNYNNHNDDHHDYGEPKAYEFGYQVKDDYTGNHHDRKEQSDGNQVRGEYRVQLPDGRTQIVTYYADWQSGFHADVRYEGEAQYPEQYNTGAGFNGGYGAPSNQYGAPSGGHQDFGGSYNGGGYNNAASSSVSIKDYSSGGTTYNTGSSGYSAGNTGYSGSGGYNYNTGYESGYNAGSFANKGRPTSVYGAP